jgi:hypothetical protein
VGQVLILAFIIYAQNPAALTPVSAPDWLLWLSIALTLITLFVAIFRCWNATEAIEEAEKIAQKKVESPGSATGS